MSIKTTHYVTRSFAQQAIAKKMMEKMAEIHILDDEKLADLLEDMLHDGFKNFIVISDEQLVNEKRRGSPYLDDLNNLPEENNAY